MAGRHTNLALLLVVPLAVGTGAAAYAVGAGPIRPVVVAHGVVGLAIIVLARPKSRIVVRGLRRSRTGRAGSVALGVALVLTLASGVTHATGLARSWGPVTALQVHVTAALLAIPFFVQHVVARARS